MSKLQKLLLAWLLLCPVAKAQDVYVPDALRDWAQWVLEGREYLDCPFLFDRRAASESDFVCAWPGALDLNVTAQGARFSLRWTVYAGDQWLPLPGSTEYWPDDVTVDGRPGQVVARDDEPALRLGPGEYRIAGRFEWDERPGVLRLPQGIGLVVLTLDGAPVARPERNNAGIFLGERREEAEVRNVVTPQVFRLVRDDVPTRLVTRLQLDVSGGVREEVFGPFLPAGFVPLDLSSPLPARLEPDGNLRVQVRPGRWNIAVTARGPGALDRIALEPGEQNMPSAEIWSYQSNERLRVTSAEGLPPVDPAQANAPDDWRHLPAFRAAPGQALAILERSRGIVGAENRLSLNRQMWLDFDGDGFIVSDDVGGDMRTGWRLDMREPYALLSARERGDDLLVTRGAEAGLSGVELRQPAVSLNALGRAGTREPMAVTGWDARMTDVSAVLNVPPGHKLLAAPGVDRADGSWTGQWHLLDFFLVLIVTIGTWRLFGRVAGTVALLALTLSFHEAGAPAWLWLNMLVAVALMRVAPGGRLRQAARAYEIGSAALLLLALVPFVANQLRIGIYPQLEPQYGFGVETYYGGGQATLVQPAAAPPEELAMKRELSSLADQSVSREVEEIVVTGAQVQAPDAYTYSRYAPNEIVQAGLGRPDWHWNSYRLEWSGPVEASQAMRLVILPRWTVSILRFLQVALLLALAAVIAAEVLRRTLRLPGGLMLGRATNAAVLLLAVAGGAALAPTDAFAQMPDTEILEELERRLTAPPECAPRCAEIISAEATVSETAMNLLLTVNALDDVALPLPGSEQGWRPAALAVDGTAAGQVQRGPGPSLWLRLPPGRHTVTLRGELPQADSVEIPFPLPPRVVRAEAAGWLVSGVRDRRLLTGSLQLTRLQQEAATAGDIRWEASRFPAFARITRTLRLDLDWSVETVVERLAPAEGAIALDVPLLAGESVLTETVSVRDGRALVSMEPRQRIVAWRSSLPRTSPLDLGAGDSSAWQEVWLVGTGSIWHASYTGVPESDTPQADGGARLAAFYPRGGESLRIETTRPEPSPGSPLVFDSARLSIDAGSRSRDVNLSLAYRSTRGAQHVLNLPEGAELTQVMIDGRIEPLRAANGELTIPVLPGEHGVDITWRTAESMSTVSRTPAVDIGAPASNINIALDLPPNRWLLATAGPPLGPAVLYWSELAVLVLFALILGRVRLTPLRTRHWLLLGLGFSTFSWLVLAWVAAWLLACGARERWRGEAPWWQFNAAQVGVAVLTVTALFAIVTSLPQGLLGTPDMHVTGFDSYGNALRWFADQSDSVLPSASAWTVPLWIYKALILAWALWLSFALLRWLPWAWKCFSSQGYWRPADRLQRGGETRQ